MKIDDVVILIVVHNHSHCINKLLESCANLIDINKYICDAASSDGSGGIISEYIKDRCDFFFYRNDVLKGFSENNNDLIRKYELYNKDIVLINPDCYFSSSDFYLFYDGLRAQKNVGVAAPMLYFPDGSVQNNWRKFPSLFKFIGKRLGLLNKYIDEYSEFNSCVVPIEWALGAFLYINKDLVQLGGGVLDERYRLYCEDVDLCMSAHAKGMRVIGIKGPIIYHELQQKSAKIFTKYNFWNVQSAFRFFLKWKLSYFKLVKILR